MMFELTHLSSNINHSEQSLGKITAGETEACGNMFVCDQPFELILAQ